MIRLKLFTPLAGGLLAAAMTGAFAVEGTQFDPPVGNLKRADVKAEMMRDAHRGAHVLHLGEATVFVDSPGSVDRPVARAARAVPAASAPSAPSARTVTGTTTGVLHLGEATEFVYAPSVRSRAEVRAEALARVAASR
ncbi:hypothetical protein [Piscinibacter sp.]|uniref:hypothetical protein n=1 Tax=Piscinibacter sp. TaxID=1903157 RepID=UPI002BBFF384|nr:hypothetical protein [Albitalea sp.]HUG26306.1 hypothetical protein [Albitalea sp.]